MPANANGDNMLCRLAQTLSAGGRHSTATALRKLAEAGYTSLEQVECNSDWILLQVPGIGTRRLAEVRWLSRPHWQPPSSQAIKAASWFLSAAQFALYYWPLEALASLVRDPTGINTSGGPLEKQLAMDVFSLATQKARQCCESEELLHTLWQIGGDCSPGIRLAPGLSPEAAMQPPALASSHVEMPAPSSTVLHRGEDDTSQDSDHFAHPRHKRMEIVRHYWIARENRDIKNKDAWARSQYQISGKTLLCYEREFQDQREAILAGANAG
jgi:hypothetical protein